MEDLIHPVASSLGISTEDDVTGSYGDVLNSAQTTDAEAGIDSTVDFTHGVRVASPVGEFVVGLGSRFGEVVDERAHRRVDVEHDVGAGDQVVQPGFERLE